MKKIFTFFAIIIWFVFSPLVAYSEFSATSESATVLNITLRPEPPMDAALMPVEDSGVPVMISSTQPLFISITLADFEAFNDNSENASIDGMLKTVIPDAVASGRLSQTDAQVLKERLEKRRHPLAPPRRFLLDSDAGAAFQLVAINDRQIVSLPWTCFSSLCRTHEVIAGGAAHFSARFGVDGEVIARLKQGEWKLQVRFKDVQSQALPVTITGQAYPVSSESLLLYRGSYYHYKQDYPQMFKESQIALARFPNSISLLVLKGDALNGLKHDTEALFAYEKALSLWVARNPHSQELPEFLMAKIDALRDRLSQKSIPISSNIKR